jgi:hypothetical protein
METEPNYHINNERIEAIAEEILSCYQVLPLPNHSQTEETTEFTTIADKRKKIFDHVLNKYHVLETERARLNDVLAKKIALKKKGLM